MKRILLTGFEPFLTFAKNPTEMIVKHLHNKTIYTNKIIGKILPVDFSSAGNTLIAYIQQYNPDIIISLGVAGSRNHISPERIAINCNDGPKDNAGYIPKNEKIIPNGDDGIFSTLPNERIIQQLINHNLPAKISNSAGTYLCNNVMYHSLYYIHKNKLPIQSGFIHIPLSTKEVVQNGGKFRWSEARLLEAISISLEIL